MEPSAEELELLQPLPSCDQPQHGRDMCYKINREHWSSTLLYQLHEEGILCDITLQALDGTVVEAHSCILAAASSTLHSVLDSQPCKPHVLAFKASGSLLRHFIKFIYLGETSVALSEVAALHSIATCLRLTDLAALCLKLMQENSLAEESVAFGELVSVSDSVEQRINLISVKDEREDCSSSAKNSVLFGNSKKLAQSIKIEEEEVLEPGLLNTKTPSEVNVIPDAPASSDVEDSVDAAYGDAMDTVYLSPPPTELELCCEGCGRKFAKEAHLQNHKAYCKGKATGESFPCSRCHKTFKKKSGLTLHVNTMHKAGKSFTCDQCAKSFASHKLLKLHMLHKVHDKDLMVQCEKCSRKFGNQKSLDMHKDYCKENRSVPSQQNLCQFCAKSFPNPSRLKHHLISHSKERPFKCAVCNKTYKTAKALQVHSELHLERKTYCCSYCGKTYLQASALYIHEKGHYTEKAFECSQCGMKFLFQSQLKNHSLVHSTEKTHMCQECGKTFKTASDLGIHQRIHKGEYPYTCQHCGKGFTTLGPCKAHERTHTGEKPYACKYCPKRFSHSATWRSHLMIHTGDKPYECKECGLSFRKSDHLKNHMNSKHSDDKTLHQCMECGDLFRTVSSLKQHKRVQHTEPQTGSLPQAQSAQTLEYRSHFFENTPHPAVT